MELYNSIIEKVNGHLGSTVPKKYAYNPDKTWEDVGGNQLIMMKESTSSAPLPTKICSFGKP